MKAKPYRPAYARKVYDFINRQWNLQRRSVNDAIVVLALKRLSSKSRFLKRDIARLRRVEVTFGPDYRGE